MRFATYVSPGGEVGIAAAVTTDFRGLLRSARGYPGDLETLVSFGLPGLLNAGEQILSSGTALDPDSVGFLPPLSQPGRVFCVGLNYRAHADEAKHAVPLYPTVFVRFPSSLVGHRQPMKKPRNSEQFDYEGELVAVIGRRGRHIPRPAALDHVVGYSICNDGSVRDFQLRTSQWTLGKNFDQSGAFGPWLVTADSLPPGGKGLRLKTRLNGRTVQNAGTDEMVFDVASLVSSMSEALTLEPGDLIVTGTPAGVGGAHNPTLYMNPGDVCEIEIEGIGTLRNWIEAE
jgi:acylpyruvate hydrolase